MNRVIRLCASSPMRWTPPSTRTSRKSPELPRPSVCGSWGPETLTPVEFHNGSAPMTDLSLKQSVLDELAWDASVTEAHIGVTARDGVVTLTGHVGSYAERCAVEHAVGRVCGVKAIAEELEIRYLYNFNHGDEDIAKQALNVLSWDLSIPKDRVKVKVE